MPPVSSRMTRMLKPPLMTSSLRLEAPVREGLRLVGSRRSKRPARHATLGASRLRAENSVVGGFSYSHGLEWVVETGKVKDAATLGSWIEDLLVHGAGRTDAIFLAEAWRAISAGDAPLLNEVAELAAAFAPSAERRLETLARRR